MGPTDSVEVKTAGSHKAGSQRVSCVVQVPDPTAWKVTLGVWACMPRTPRGPQWELSHFPSLLLLSLPVFREGTCPMAKLNNKQTTTTHTETQNCNGHKIREYSSDWAEAESKWLFSGLGCKLPGGASSLMKKLLNTVKYQNMSRCHHNKLQIACELTH